MNLAFEAQVAQMKSNWETIDMLNQMGISYYITDNPREAGMSWLTLGSNTMMPNVIKAGTGIANAARTTKVGVNLTPKIVKQMGSRGWSEGLINSTVRNPHTTRVATNKATGNAATAFFTKEGAYVVRDNVTGQIIQVSNRLDPRWVPDATIINPYIPK
jgi:hypothetical protein